MKETTENFKQRETGKLDTSIWSDISRLCNQVERETTKDTMSESKKAQQKNSMPDSQMNASIRNLKDAVAGKQTNKESTSGNLREAEAGKQDNRAQGEPARLSKEKAKDIDERFKHAPARKSATDVDERYKSAPTRDDSIWGDISRLCNDVAKIKLRVDKAQEDVLEAIYEGVTGVATEAEKAAESGVREGLRFADRKLKERDEIDEAILRFLGFGPSEDTASRIPKQRKQCT